MQLEHNLQISFRMSSMKRHICLAEDDQDDYYLFSRILGEISDSNKLTWFKTGEDLLQYLKTGNELPDIIVLDMNMPKIDGPTCLRILKKEVYWCHIPVAILSTGDSPTAIKTAYEDGAHRYFVKPFTIEEFRKIIQEILLL
ncbi:Response regulator receiver domain-containing protein [Niastella yeongjuensis]|nr:Response regulator receiver domain-containing protein [Niastella yeongjuensis]